VQLALKGTIHPALNFQELSSDNKFRLSQSHAMLPLSLHKNIAQYYNKQRKNQQGFTQKNKKGAFKLVLCANRRQERYLLSPTTRARLQNSDNTLKFPGYRFLLNKKQLNFNFQQKRIQKDNTFGLQ